MSREDVNQAELVDQLLADLTARCGGYPGPTPAGWAHLAAAAVRGLNHASFSGKGYPHPGDVDAVVAELTTLARRLPQALLQAARALSTAHDAGDVVDVRDPARTHTTVTLDAVIPLKGLAAVTDRLESGLARVHSATSHLTSAAPHTDDHDQGDAGGLAGAGGRGRGVR